MVNLEGRSREAGRREARHQTLGIKTKDIRFLGIMTKLYGFFCICSFFLLGLTVSQAQVDNGVRPFGPFSGCCLQHIDRDMHTFVAPPRHMASRAHCAGFQFSYFGGPPAQQVQDGLQYAADIWSSLLVSNVPIKINIVYISWSSLGTSIASPIKNFPGTPDTNIWYPYALADAITGVDQKPGEDDMTIFLDNATNWYFGLDGNVPGGQIDFVSVALHEIGHGLGFTSLANKPMNEGSFGMITAADLGLPALPFPPLEGLPGIFDKHLIHGPSGFFLTDTMLFANPSQQLGDFFTGGQVFLTGTQLLAANANQTAKIHAVGPYSFGTTMTHLDEALYPPGDTNTLMSPFIGNAEANHHPGPITLGLFQDMGWQLCEHVGVEEELGNWAVEVYPNPVVDRINVKWEKPLTTEGIFQVYDLQGKIIFAKTINPGTTESEILPGNSLPHGLYFWELIAGAGKTNGKLLVK